MVVTEFERPDRQDLVVAARDRWSSVISVEAGRQYTFGARGIWIDAYIKCGPEGYSVWWLRLFEPLRVLPTANWFCLVGRFDRDERDVPAMMIEIGARCTWTAAADGKITFFANDVPGMYWNNRGEVALEILRR